MRNSLVAVAKKKWRTRMKSRLDLLRPWESASVGDRLRENLRLLVGRHPGVWGTYHPLPGEADPAIGNAKGIEWVYPRMRDDALEFCRGDAFWKGRYGVTEPDDSCPAIEPGRMAGVLVPGLAFDREGGRLGRGRGFYDRTLAGFDGLVVGVAFSVQLVERIPTDPWDEPMDAIVTEESVIMFE